MTTYKGREAFVTLATNDVYSQGSLVLAQSLRRHKTVKELVVMVTPQISSDVRCSLEMMFDRVICVDVLDSEDSSHLALLKRPELGVTFTKLHCWTLTEYDKCVFMDADTMALTNIDELFEREELSASPDAGWPDMFNSGVFVFQPSIKTFSSLINLADTEGSFDGGDQGLLNTYFNTWSTSGADKRLSFLYNMHSTSTYTYSPAFARFGHETKVVHFIGSIKPWNHKYDYKNDVLQQAEGPGIHEEEFIKLWWRLLRDSSEQFLLDQETHSINNSPIERSDSPVTSDVQKHDIVDQRRIEEQKTHQWMWQTSQVDYMGEDKFVNIQAKMDHVLRIGSTASVVSTPPSSLSDEASCGESEELLLDDDVISNTELLLDDADVIDGSSPRPHSPTDDVVRYHMWREGSTDYLGRDSFANIQARIDKILLNEKKSNEAVDDRSKNEIIIFPVENFLEIEQNTNKVDI